MDASASHRTTGPPLPAEINSEPSIVLEQMSRDLPEKATTTMEWTDEKHSMYLESMETTFVNQLYDSMDLLGWRPQNDSSKEIDSSKHLHRTHRPPSGQFKVLREGNWKKLNFEKSDFHQSRVDESFGFVTSPWIQRFRQSKVEEAELPSKNHQQQKTKLDENFAEVSDQNFVDEDEQKGQSTTNATKQRANSWSTRDQVVPRRDLSRRRSGSSAK